MSRTSLTRLTPEQVLPMLAATPQRLAALTAEVPADCLETRPAPDEWSANDVLVHLRGCADVWGDYIAAMLAEDRPTLRGKDPRHWPKLAAYRELAFEPSLQDFARQRTALLAVLGALAPDGWSRTATVTAWGTPYERSVLEYARRLARHEQPHIKQIERIVSALQ